MLAYSTSPIPADCGRIYTNNCLADTSAACEICTDPGRNEMPKASITKATTILQTTQAKEANIEQAFANFLEELGSPALAAKARPVVDVLSKFLNNNEATEWRQNPSFTEREKPSAMIKYLDRYLRYNLLRELRLSFEQIEYLSYGTYALVEWLGFKNYLSKRDVVEFEFLRDSQLSKWERAYTAAESIDTAIHKSKALDCTGEEIEFERHDIAEIKDNQIWLEIWSPPILPKERHIGPITLPKNVTRLLEKGWIISCALQQTKQGWKIVESGNVYPALPY